MAIGALGSPNPFLVQFSHTQKALQTALNNESTGKKINSAVDGPAQYAIATSLQTQVAAFDAATQNVQTAYNATNVASSALGSVSGILSRLRTLAVQGVNDFLSPTQRSALQTEANQLVTQANAIAQKTNFNGANLLNGQYAGANAGSPAQAAVTSNPFVAQGGKVVTQVSAANPNFQNSNGAAQGFGGNATTDSTIQVHIVANNQGQAVAQVTAVDAGTGKQITLPGTYASGATVSGVQNVNIKLGNFSTLDIGTTATIQITGHVAANTQGSALQVQSGANQGNTTGINYGNVSAASLHVANINLSSSANATNAIGQLDTAIKQLGGIQAQLGAQQNALASQVEANDYTANNLQTAQSNIADANIGIENTNSTLSAIQSQLALAVLAQRNTQSAGVLTLFSH